MSDLVRRRETRARSLSLPHAPVLQVRRRGEKRKRSLRVRAGCRAGMRAPHRSTALRPAPAQKQV